MKVAGFTFVKNAIKYKYPIVESIKSVLPLCDEFVIAVGDSEDDTVKLLESIQDSKIKIIHTIWEESLQKDGLVLSEETNKAYAYISSDVDWAFYIQGDELIHEKDIDAIKLAMLKYKDNNNVDGLLFKYYHFYGSYQYLNDSGWYGHEIRIVRKNNEIYSYKDAQGFRKCNNKKLNVIPIDAYIYHYGWVRPPEIMKNKNINFNKFYLADAQLERKRKELENFEYISKGDVLKRFKGSHPAIMKKQISNVDWEFKYIPSFNKNVMKKYIKKFLKHIGINTYYENYTIISDKDIK